MFKFTAYDSGYEEEQNDLHILCQTGSLGEIITFLQSSPRGSKLHWYYDGQSALHITVLSGRKDTCDVLGVLLDYGANIDAQTIGECHTALHLLVLRGVFPRDIDTLVFLLEHRADLSIRNKTLRTPYDCAIASGQYDLAGILNGSVSPDKAKEFYTRICKKKYGPEIINAVLESNKPKLRKNLELGGDPNVLNKHGLGAIHYAVFISKLPVYETLLSLLEFGADVNMRNEIKGDTALNLVIKNQKLRDNGVMLQCVQLLIDWGASPDLQDVDGKDAYQLASEKNYADVAIALKKKPKKKSSNKSERKKNVVFKEIIPQQNDRPQSFTPIPDKPPSPVADTELEVSTVESPKEIPTLPLKTLPEVTMLNDEAARHVEIKNLLEKGVDINQKEESAGNTALHICAEKNYGNTAKLLLDQNIDFKIQNKNGKTAYDLARVKRNTPVMKAISEKQQQLLGPPKQSSSCAML